MTDYHMADAIRANVHVHLATTENYLDVYIPFRQHLLELIRNARNDPLSTEDIMKKRVNA